MPIRELQRYVFICDTCGARTDHWIDSNHLLVSPPEGWTHAPGRNGPYWFHVEVWCRACSEQREESAHDPR